MASVSIKAFAFAILISTELGPFLALGQTAQHSSSSTVRTPPVIDERTKKLWREEREVKEAVRKAERKEMVRPAPPGFVPLAVDKKVRLSLTVKNTTIRAGERIWYKLELQNVGRKPVTVWEARSALKNPLEASTPDWDCYVTDPGGQRKIAVTGDFVEQIVAGHRPRRNIKVPGSEQMTEEEVQAWIRRDGWRREAEADLDVVLQPGETVASLPWRWITNEEYLDRFNRGEAELYPRPPGEFRELLTDYRFKAPGRYKLQFVFESIPPDPPTEAELWEDARRGLTRASSMKRYQLKVDGYVGLLNSNEVEITVVP